MVHPNLRNGREGGGSTSCRKVYQHLACRWHALLRSSAALCKVVAGRAPTTWTAQLGKGRAPKRAPRPGTAAPRTSCTRSPQCCRPCAGPQRHVPCPPAHQCPAPGRAADGGRRRRPVLGGTQAQACGQQGGWVRRGREGLVPTGGREGSVRGAGASAITWRRLAPRVWRGSSGKQRAQSPGTP